MVFDEVQADLEAAGYEFIPFVLPAAGVNAPHRRDRVWFVGHRIITNANGSGNTQSELQQPNISSGSGGSNKETPQNPLRCGCTQREPDQDGAEVRQFGNAGAGDCDGVRGAEVGGVAADTELHGHDGRATTQGQQHDGGRQARSESASPIERRVITDTIGAGGGENYRESKGESDVAVKISAPGNWDNFPTQPPVRGRNDELPSGLVRATVSSRRGRRTLTDVQLWGKIRNESIKAYGNAIVPQVALQIFRAIQQYEHLNTTP